MGFLGSLISGLLGAAVDGGRKRHKGRYGQPGAFRKTRNGDLLGRGKNGRYKK